MTAVAEKESKHSVAMGADQMHGYANPSLSGGIMNLSFSYPVLPLPPPGCHA
jgi:hypothetical protein